MEDETDNLEDRTRKVIEEQLVESDLGEQEKMDLKDDLRGGKVDPGITDKPEAPEMKKKQNELDEKVEKDATDEIPGPWNSREIEFLAQNRKEMSNEEMKEFFEGRNEVQQHEWSPFSRSEERFILQNHQSLTPEEIADSLDREKRSVELQMTLMGIDR